jgi:hypothetical protein
VQATTLQYLVGFGAYFSYVLVRPSVAYGYSYGLFCASYGLPPFPRIALAVHRPTLFWARAWDIVRLVVFRTLRLYSINAVLVGSCGHEDLVSRRKSQGLLHVRSSQDFVLLLRIRRGHSLCTSIYTSLNPRYIYKYL